MTARHPVIGGKQRRIRQERPPKPIIEILTCECGEVHRLAITEGTCEVIVVCGHCGAILRWYHGKPTTIEMVCKDEP